jgi:hypothetical protein
MVNRLMMRLALSAALYLVSAAHAATLTASLSESRIGPADTVTLSVQTDGNLNLDVLDFAVLEVDFALSNPATSSQVSFMNGQQTQVRERRIDLQPKRVGRLTIPAFELSGARSAELIVEVSDAHRASPDIGTEPIVLKAEVATREAYVQQQIVYTLKLYYAVNLSEGAIDELNVPNAVVERLGQDERSMTEINGQRYQVLERRYLVVPEQSGELQIPSVSLRARVVSSGGSVFDSFFNRGRSVEVPSEAITVTVKPRPAGFSGAVWLPATSVAISEAPLDESVQVGDAITRKLRIDARGLSATQLPAFSIDAPPGAQVYPDQPSRVTRAEGNEVVATLEQNIALLPAQAGTLKLPPIQIRWWDVAADAERIAELPAQTLTVRAASGVASVPTPTADSASVLPATSAVTTSSPLWPIVSSALLVLTLGAFAQIWRLNQRLKRLAAPPAERAIDDANRGNAERLLKRAIGQSDAAAATTALLKLAAVRGISARNLSELAAQLDGPFAITLRALEQARYAARAESPDLTALNQAFVASNWPSATRRTNAVADPLPPLYAR